ARAVVVDPVAVHVAAAVDAERAALAAGAVDVARAGPARPQERVPFAARGEALADHLAAVVDIAGEARGAAERAQVEHAGLPGPQERVQLPHGGRARARALIPLIDRLGHADAVGAAERAQVERAALRRPQERVLVAVGGGALAHDVASLIDVAGQRAAAEGADDLHSCQRRPDERAERPACDLAHTDDLSVFVDGGGFALAAAERSEQGDAGLSDARSRADVKCGEQDTGCDRETAAPGRARR